MNPSQPPGSVLTTDTAETSAVADGDGGFPALLSDEEFEVRVQQRRQSGRLEYDGPANVVILTKPVQTDGRPESTLERQFVHIAQQIVAKWPSESCARYLKRLVIADRASRHGFPPDVANDLMMLYQINEMLCQSNGPGANGSGRFTSESRFAAASGSGFGWSSLIRK